MDNPIRDLSPSKKETLDSIVTLWDSTTKDMDRLYSLLMDGKSELAAIMLDSYKSLHNTQSRVFLYTQLVALALNSKEKTR